MSNFPFAAIHPIKSPNLSDKYNFLPTTEILKPLEDNGFSVRYTHQGRSANPYSAKHLIAMVDKSKQFLDSYPEIVVINSHNGQSSLQLRAGIFRTLCSNGLIIGTEIVKPVSIPHIGIDNRLDKVIEFVKDFQSNTWRMIDLMDNWNRFDLDMKDQITIVRRINDQRMLKNMPIVSINALNPSLDCDQNNDLWTVYNRLQHNIINGACRYNKAGSNKWHKSRAIKSVDGLMIHNNIIFNACDSFYNDMR